MTGVAVMLIGVSLISAGIKYVGGGVFCAENDLSRSASFGAPQPCNENGNVVLFFGVLKTPYAIGTIAALFLHLLLPEDRVLDEEKEHYPRAFSDGEIAYET